MVGKDNEVGNNILQNRKQQPTLQRASQPKGKRQFHPLGGIPLLRKYLEPYGIDKVTQERIVSHAWRGGTVKLYAHYLRKWQLFCTLRQIDPLKPLLSQVLRYLRTLEDDGLGFGALNTARCALSVILPREHGETMGKNHVIHWLLKSVYERNPPKPKYSRFWDVSLVFKLLKSWPDNEFLSLRDISYKVAILILLITGHRGQTVIALNIETMEITKNEVTFELQKLLKSNRTGDPLSSVTMQVFAECKKLCGTCHQGILS